MLTINNTIDGAIQDIEIKGNTVQNPDNLADIKSVGELQEDGTYKMSILSCGKNLFDKKLEFGGYNGSSGNPYVASDRVRTINKTYLKKGSYIITCLGSSTVACSVWHKDTFYREFAVNSNSLTLTLEQDSYVNFTFVTTNLNAQIQLEEGTSSTTYEPYQENKCDILLPCQLEKGDILKKVNGVWGIEKEMKTIIADGVNVVARGVSVSSGNNVIAIDLNDICFTGWGATHQQNHFCDLLENGVDNANINWGNSPNHIMAFTGGVWLSCDKSITSTTQANEYLKNKPHLIKYPTITPTFITLPLSTQIQLNSFFGTTHIYMESGEVEGTIKCKIPKSLGATVQSLNNKTDILCDRIEAIEGLKDSQNMKYETDKGYLVCKETKNGVIDDLKLEGKTLVNLAKQPTGNGKVNGVYATVSETTYNIKPLTEYTYIIKNNGQELVDLYLNNQNCFPWTRLQISSGDILISKATSIAEIKGKTWLSVGVAQTMEQNLQVVLLEGDHTQNPPSYFEGLMSVGQDVDKIEVLSDNNKINNIDNMFATIDIASGTVIGINNRKNIISGFNLVSNNTNSIKLYDKDMNVVSGSANYSDITRRYYDKNYNYLGANLTDNAFFVRYRCLTRNNYEMGGLATDYIFKDLYQDYSEYTRDKKQILFYNSNGELEPIQELHEWDSIEKHSDNKWYYHKRSGKVVLNGSENTWGVSQYGNNENTLAFTLVSKGVKESSVICDKFSYSFNWNDIEHVHSNTNAINITISRNKLSTQDVAGFKQWLQANNVTVVYQLAQEEVYELASLHLDSYANETLILCNSGAISPKMEFSITSHINELVKAYGERINLLEEKVYKYMVTQNRIQLASTYSADSVTFKVDYFSLCGDEENYDEDLYNLILNNILVGKDNYDYDKMFTIILDYASWNQISWEQFDILVGLMDIQHNPPVEELPTEDEIEEDIIEKEETPVE